MNHKNFSFTLVLIYSLPWNCSPQHYDRLSILLLVTDYLIFHLLTLPRYLFSNLSKNSLLHLFGDLCVRLRIVGRSLPEGNSLSPRSSSLTSPKIFWRTFFDAFGASKPYNVKTFHCTRLVALQSTAKLVSSTAPKRRCSSHTFRYGYLVTT